MDVLRKSKSLFIVLLSVVLFVSCKEEQKEVPLIKVPFIEIETADVPIYREFPAQAYGDLDIDLVARVEGNLVGIHFREGERVKKGQLLYTIDPMEYDSRVDNEKGRVAAFRGDYMNAELELKRIRPLADMNAVSKRELDAAITRVQTTKSSLESAEASLKNKQLERSYCNIQAPIDGVIGMSSVRLGDYVSKSQNTSILNTISKLNEVRVRFAVSEASYLKYRKAVGENGEVINNFELILSDESVYPMKGKLNFSDTKIDPTTGTVTLEAQFPNPNGTIFPGQFVKIQMIATTERNAIVVPQRAVTEMQGIYQVFIIDKDNTVQVAVVKVGAKVGTNWIVTEGLLKGTKLAIIGSLFVQPGSKVKPVPYNEGNSNATNK